jgi:transposase
VLDGDGTQLFNRNFDNGSWDLRAVLEELEPGTGIAFEAAYGWGWLADLLEELRLEAHLAHPSACKAIASARLKNDRVDARMLAHLLRDEVYARPQWSMVMARTGTPVTMTRPS